MDKREKIVLNIAKYLVRLFNIEFDNLIRKQAGMKPLRKHYVLSQIDYLHKQLERLK